MKSLVLSAMICAAAMGNTNATTFSNSVSSKEKKTALSYDQKNIDAFREKIAFHQKNLEVLWNQYDMAVGKISQSHGNHDELDKDYYFFESVYLKDIAEGKRVEQSKKAIAELQAVYAEKHAQRETYEEKELARLQAQLKAQLNKEKVSFKALKKEYAHLVNEQTLPLLLRVEQQFGRSNDTVAKMNNDEKDTLIIVSL